MSTDTLASMLHAETTRHLHEQNKVSHERSERPPALTQGGLPVELDVGHAALLVDQGVCVHAKALHVAIVQGNANVVL